MVIDSHWRQEDPQHGDSVLPGSSAFPVMAPGWYIPILFTGGNNARATS